MLVADQTVILDVEKPAVGGRMIARAGGQVVLVAGGIPGERASVRIERLGKGIAFGQVVGVAEPSPDRRQAPDALCGGCLYNYIRYERQLALKRQVIVDAMARIGRIPWLIPIGVVPSPEEGYRMRARVHVRRGRLGFFREGSHDLCEARTTRQLLPAACDALDALAITLGAGARVETAEIDVSENVTASERVVHLELAAAIEPDALRGLAAGPGLTGMTMSVGPIRGQQQAAVLHGDSHVEDRFEIGGQTVVIRRHVLSFFQGNRFLLDDLLRHVLDQIEPGADVVDLYAGAGLFSIGAAVARQATVTAVEGDLCGVEDLRSNARACGERVRPVHDAVETFTAGCRDRPAVLIVDPPRTGMSKAAAAGAIGLRARRVVYVSCDVATLARDARRFLDAGYDIRGIEAFDLFPNTPHVETVVVMERG